MLELMNPVALELGTARRREIAEETMRAARSSGAGARGQVGSALMLVGQKLGGQQATPRPQMQPTSDCI